MNIRKMTAVLAAAALGGGLALVAVAAPASAHTPEVTATCDRLYIELSDYTIKPAIGEPEIEVANPDYVPAVDAVEGQSHVEYLYVGWGALWQLDEEEDVIFSGGKMWVRDPLGHTRTVVDVEAVEGQPAVGEPTIWVENPDYVDTDWVPNAFSVEVDDEVLFSEEDGQFDTFASLGLTLDGTVAHTYKVRVRAWDDPTGEFGWSKNFTGTTTPCVVTPPTEEPEPTEPPVEEPEPTEPPVVEPPVEEPVVEEPVIEEPAVVTPPAVATPAAPTSAAPAAATPVAAVPASTEGELAETGFDAMWLPYVAAAALILGLGSFVVSRRRAARRNG